MCVKRNMDNKIWYTKLVCSIAGVFVLSAAVISSFCFFIASIFWNSGSYITISLAVCSVSFAVLLLVLLVVLIKSKSIWVIEVDGHRSCEKRG